MLGIFTMVRSNWTASFLKVTRKISKLQNEFPKRIYLKKRHFVLDVQSTHVYEKWEKLKREHTRGNDFHKKIGLDQNTTEHNKTLARTQTKTHIKMAQDINKYTASSNALNDSDLRIYMHYNTWTMLHECTHSVIGEWETGRKKKTPRKTEYNHKHFLSNGIFAIQIYARVCENSYTHTYAKRRPR